MNDLKDFEGVYSEGGTYMKCPECGFLISSSSTTIDDLETPVYFYCGKCQAEFYLLYKAVEILPLPYQNEVEE